MKQARMNGNNFYRPHTNKSVAKQNDANVAQIKELSPQNSSSIYAEKKAEANNLYSVLVMLLAGNFVLGGYFLYKMTSGGIQAAAAAFGFNVDDNDDSSSSSAVF